MFVTKSNANTKRLPALVCAAFVAVCSSALADDSANNNIVRVGSNLGFKIDFENNSAGQAMLSGDWKTGLKEIIIPAAKLLSSYVATDAVVNLTFKAAVGDTTLPASGWAITSGPSFQAVENNNSRFLTKACTIGINAENFKNGAWDGVGPALILHEIFHCLGFTDSVSAFKAHIQNGHFNGPETKRLNGGKAPELSDDHSHFIQGFQDPADVAPRMDAGGGKLLSVLDLAVLKDIGYMVPVLDNMASAICLGFELGPAFSKRYRETQYLNKPQATAHVPGTCGNDSLHPGTGEAWILEGGKGNDTFFASNKDYPTVMVGSDGADRFVVTVAKTTSNLPAAMIYGVEAGDKIEIASSLITIAQLQSLKDAGLYTDAHTYIKNNAPFIPYKIEVGDVQMVVWAFRSERPTLVATLKGLIELDTFDPSSCDVVAYAKTIRDYYGTEDGIFDIKVYNQANDLKETEKRFADLGEKAAVFEDRCGAIINVVELRAAAERVTDAFHIYNQVVFRNMRQLGNKWALKSRIAQYEAEFAKAISTAKAAVVTASQNK